MAILQPAIQLQYSSLCQGKNRTTHYEMVWLILLWYCSKTKRSHIHVHAHIWIPIYMQLRIHVHLTPKLLTERLWLKISGTQSLILCKTWRISHPAHHRQGSHSLSQRRVWVLQSGLSWAGRGWWWTFSLPRQCQVVPPHLMQGSEVTCMYMYMRISVNNISLGYKQPSGVESQNA